jgi:hypothetical protein
MNFEPPCLGDFLRVAERVAGAKLASALGMRAGKRDDVSYLCRDNLLLVIPTAMKESDQLTKRQFKSWCKTLGITEAEFYK